MYRCRVFRVNDSLVNMSRTWIMELCEALIASRLDIFWYGHARAATIDDELAETLYRAGCRYLKLGIESGSDRVLELMSKHATCEQMARGLEVVHAAGIRTRASFILGFPGEEVADLEATAAFIAGARGAIDELRLFENLLLPGSEVAIHPERYGVELQTHDLPRLANHRVAELARQIPRSWRCTQTDALAERRAELAEELAPLIAGDRQRLLPPAFPELLADALASDPVVASNGQRVKQRLSDEEETLISGLASGGERLSHLARRLGVTNEQVRAQVSKLMAVGLLRVADPPTASS
jgi:hypothetical protein